VGSGTFDGLPCPNAGEPAHLSIIAHSVVVDAYSEVTGTTGAFSQAVSASACGTVPTYNIDANNLTVFEHLSNTVQNADYSYFGRIRPHADVRLEQTNARNNSYYSSSEDAIHLLVFHVSDDFGAFLQAHEWGHAFLEKAFGHNDQGARAATDACTNHQVDAPSDPYCAYSEGFADYHSVVTYPTTTFNIEQTRYVLSHQGQGQSIEGSVAAYFLDITDGTDPNERDAVALPGKWLADVLSACEYTPFPFGGVREVAGWRKCFENQSGIRFNPAVTFPPGWDPAALSVLYDWNINGAQ